MGNATTEYTLDSSLILREKATNDPSLGSYTLNYYYDSAGKLVELGYTPANSTTETYYFVTRNSQGDIVAIYHSPAKNTVNLVGTYTYDSWGRVMAVTKASTSSDPNNILNKNPFRYRGYYFDRETNWYYLQSRYYDPQVKRFLNADDAGVLKVEQGNPGQYNLFAYCLNDPVNEVDPAGKFAITATIIAIVVASTAIGAGMGALSAHANGENVIAGAVGGGVTGLVMGAAGVLTGGASLAASTAILAGAGAATSAANSAVQQQINYGEIDAEKTIAAGVVGGVFGAAGGAIGTGINTVAPLAMEPLANGLTNAYSLLYLQPLQYVTSELAASWAN